MNLFIRLPFLGEIVTETNHGQHVRLHFERFRGELCIHWWKWSIFLTSWDRLKEDLYGGYNEHGKDKESQEIMEMYRGSKEN